jgi:hypothetical protein
VFVIAEVLFSPLLGKCQRLFPISGMGSDNIAAGVAIEHQKHPPGKPSRQGFL